MKLRGTGSSWWPGAGKAVLLALGLTLWLNTLIEISVAPSISGWSVAIPIESEVDAVARLYFAAEKGGISEQQTVDQAINGGEMQLVRFCLPREEVAELRIDPVDVKAAFKLGKPVLLGPWGQPLDEKSQRIELLAERGINVDEADDGWFRSTGPDPHFYLKIRKGPLRPPVAEMDKFSRLVLLVAGVLGAMIGGAWWWFFARGGDLCRSRAQQLTRFAAQASVAFGFMGVTLFFVWPERRLEPAVFYALSLGPMMLAAAAAWFSTLSTSSGAPVEWRPGRANLPLYWCLLLLVMLGAHVLAGLDGDSQPSRGMALGSLATLLGILMSALLWRRHASSLAGLSSGWLVGLVAVVAVLTLLRLHEYYHVGWDPQQRFPDRLSFPLHRPISGSGGACVLLLAWVAFACARFRGWRFAIACLGMLPLCVWIMMSQSRGIILAGSGSFLLLLWMLPGRRSIAAASVWFALAVVVFFSPLPERLTKQLSRPSLSSAPVDANPSAGDENSPLMATSPSDAVVVSVALAAVLLELTSDQAPPVESKSAELLQQRLLRTEVIRLEIWRTYWKKAWENPVFGHGFGGDQTLQVTARTDKGLPEDLLEASWNPHNVHLSYFYFCGLVGVAIEGGLLILIWLRGALGFSRHADVMALILGMLVAFAGVALLFESTLMAYSKEAVLLRLPNEYWLTYWLPLLAGSAWVSGRCLEGNTRTECKTVGQDSSTEPAENHSNPF